MTTSPPCTPAAFRATMKNASRKDFHEVVIANETDNSSINMRYRPDRKCLALEDIWEGKRISWWLSDDIVRRLRNICDEWLELPPLDKPPGA